MATSVVDESQTTTAYINDHSVEPMPSDHLGTLPLGGKLKNQSTSSYNINFYEHGYSLSLDIKGLNFCIDEPYLYEEQELLDLKIKKGGLGGGGNSGWGLSYVKDKYVLEFDISGMGNGASVNITLEDELVHELMDVIIHVNKTPKEKRSNLKNTTINYDAWDRFF